ncbi:unnamed protein product, partial [Gulo gulo]
LGKGAKKNTVLAASSCRPLGSVVGRLTLFSWPLKRGMDQFVSSLMCCEFLSPQTKKYADVIIPRGADNLVAINLIVQHIQDILNGGLSKRQTNGYLNGYIPSRKRQPSESSSRPH